MPHAKLVNIDTLCLWFVFTRSQSWTGLAARIPHVSPHSSSPVPSQVPVRFQSGPVRFQSLQTYITHTYKHKNANMHKCTLEMTFEHQCGRASVNPTRVVHCYTPNRAIHTYMYLVAISVLPLQPVPHAMDACTYITVGSLLLLTVTCTWNWLEWKNTNICHVCWPTKNLTTKAYFWYVVQCMLGMYVHPGWIS